MCFSNKYKYQTLNEGCYYIVIKTKQAENKKQTFFEILYWVIFQFFLQKCYTLYYTTLYKILLFDAALSIQKNMMQACYAERCIK